MTKLNRTIKVSSACWKEIREIAAAENLHMYQVIKSLVDQYYFQILKKEPVEEGGMDD